MVVQGTSMPLTIIGIFILGLLGALVALHELVVEVAKLKTEVRMLRERYEPDNTSKEE